MLFPTLLGLPKPILSLSKSDPSFADFNRLGATYLKVLGLAQHEEVITLRDVESGILGQAFEFGITVHCQFSVAAGVAALLPASLLAVWLASRLRPSTEKDPQNGHI
jgi:hypothetical protein